MKCSTILANPPFNMKRWGGEQLREDRRWKFGVPPASNANFAWVQHMTPRFEHNPVTKGMLPKGHAHADTRSKDVLGRTAVGVAR
jgi:type I restriction enzyme M protein